MMCVFFSVVFVSWLMCMNVLFRVVVVVCSCFVFLVVKNFVKSFVEMIVIMVGVFVLLFIVVRF